MAMACYAPRGGDTDNTLQRALVTSGTWRSLQCRLRQAESRLSSSDAAEKMFVTNAQR